MSIQLRGLDPQVRAAAEWALSWAHFYGVEVVITSTFRSLDEQARLRRRFEAGRSRFPANRPGDSAHNFGLAWDSWVPDELIPWWTHVRELAGFRVPPNDWPHAEVPGWRNFVA